MTVFLMGVDQFKALSCWRYIDGWRIDFTLPEESEWGQRPCRRWCNTGVLASQRLRVSDAATNQTMAYVTPQKIQPVARQWGSDHSSILLDKRMPGSGQNAERNRAQLCSDFTGPIQQVSSAVVYYQVAS